MIPWSGGVLRQAATHICGRKIATSRWSSALSVRLRFALAVKMNGIRRRLAKRRCLSNWKIGQMKISKMSHYVRCAKLKSKKTRVAITWHATTANTSSAGLVEQVHQVETSILCLAGVVAFNNSTTLLDLVTIKIIGESSNGYLVRWEVFYASWSGW